MTTTVNNCERTESCVYTVRVILHVSLTLLQLDVNRLHEPNQVIVELLTFVENCWHWIDRNRLISRI